MKNVRFTIRLKLLVLSLAVLTIPYLGYEYLRELDRYLRTGLESSLMDAARAAAGPLHEQYTLFPYTQNTAENSLFIQKLQSPIQLDGYTDDWLDYLGWSKIYQNENAKDEKSKLSYKLIFCIIITILSILTILRKVVCDMVVWCGMHVPTPTTLTLAGTLAGALAEGHVPIQHQLPQFHRTIQML